MGLEELAFYWEDENCGSITGTGFEDISKGFSLVSDFNKDIELSRGILEIGPGHGTTAKYIASNYSDKELYLADISSAVLDKIEIVANKYELLDLPADIVDVTYTHLVVQHIPKNLIAEFFEIVYRALRTDGKFYFQYLVAKNSSQTQVWQAGTIFHDDLDLILRLEEAGFKVNRIAKAPQDEIYWWGYCCATKGKSN